MREALWRAPRAGHVPLVARNRLTARLCRCLLVGTSFRRFWAVAARWNSSRTPFGPRNRSRSRRRMRFEVGEQHLDLLPQLPGCSALVGLGDVTGPVASALVDRPRHLARGCLRGAPRLHWACVAVVLAGAIEECRAVVHQPTRASEHLARRAEVDIPVEIVGEAATSASISCCSSEPVSASIKAFVWASIMLRPDARDQPVRQRNCMVFSVVRRRP